MDGEVPCRGFHLYYVFFCMWGAGKYLLLVGEKLSSSRTNDSGDRAHKREHPFQ